MLSRELAAALEFRTLYGLRRDMPYLEMVAASAVAQAGVAEYGVPLLPEEIADLKDRGSNASKVASSVEAYGKRHPGEWAGMFVDNAGTGAVVARFSGHVDDHLAAIRALVGPAARVEVREVRYSSVALEDLQARATADQNWLRSIDAWFEWAVVSELDNRVDLSISSTNPAAVELAAAHFGAGDALSITSDGIGHWEGGYGALIVDLVDTSGHPTGGLDEPWKCRLEPADPAAWRGGSLQLVAGRCESDEPLGATTFTITVTKPVGVDERLVASGTVRIPVDGVARLRLVAPSE